MPRALRRAPLLAAGVLACLPWGASAAFAPERGTWSGTARAGQERDPVSVRIVRRDGRILLRDLRTTARARCASPDPSAAGPTLVSTDVHVRRMRMRADRTFGFMDRDVEVKGRFTSRTRAEGTVWVASPGGTCTRSTIQFVVRAAPLACARAVRACRS